METSASQYVREDDFIECFFFPVNKNDDNVIEKIYQDVNDLLSVLSKGYIWHKDSFKVFKRLNSTSILADKFDADLPCHVYGLCHFGDNVEDEWFIVYLIKEITKKLSSLAAKVVDADGEFLLIEAANDLPPWANPSNCDNRVFFYNGLLHIIAPDNINEKDNDFSVRQALQKLHTNSKDNLASDAIQQDVIQRIIDYPSKIDESLYKTTVYTPVGVASLLQKDPSLISAAVHAYCNRDSIDLKVCRAMRYFPPENRVNTSVTFTKCLYAMLVHSNFNPDRRTGWNMPLANSPQYKAHSAGVKLACGFEILVSQARPDDDLESNRAWKDYVQSLNKRNYFQNLLEGSQGYNALLEKAKEFFVGNLDFVKVGPVIGGRILNMLGEITIDENEFRRNEGLLPEDDDDKWLTIDPVELESLLQRRYGMKNFSALNSQTVPSMFSEKISEFLEHTSSIDGVEFPENTSNTNEKIESCDFPSRPKRGIKLKKNQGKGVSFCNSMESRSPSPARKTKIDFNADQFSGAIQNILDLVIPEDNWDLDSDTDLSEYGSNDELESNVFELPCNGGANKNDADMKRYMDEMDSQLSSTVMGKSFETVKTDNNSQVVDMDTNVLKNMMESFKGEMGGVGPAGSILGPLGFTKIENMIPIDDEVD